MSGSGQGKRVLVVEDDERLLFAMTEVLEQAGYQTRTAGDGQMAIQRLSTGYTPDVIVLDVQMPFVTGLEVLAWMRQNDVRIPVVLATQEDEVKAADVGAVVKLIKPFTLEQLLEAVEFGGRANPAMVIARE
jgi:DNA-binding response OmpR family regulator